MLTHAETNGGARINDSVGPQSALVRCLTEAYWMEVETLSKYAMSSTNRDGIHAPRVGRCLRDAIACNLDHAHRLAMRVTQLHGPTPTSDEFASRALGLRSPEDPREHSGVLSGVIEAEAAAINRYRRILETVDAGDWITRDLMIKLIREKQAVREQLESHLADPDTPSGDASLCEGRL